MADPTTEDMDVVVVEESQPLIKPPQKRWYRSRAHANPLTTHIMKYPVKPSAYPWAQLYPKHIAAGTAFGEQKKVTIADIGCGFGGLLMALSPLFPDKLMIGMEIRMKVAEYVYERIVAGRANGEGYDNVSVTRTNSMKLLPMFFERGQLEKMFFLFPDPHFKAKNHRRRIISYTLLAEYAYTLAIGGLLYTVTDVLDLHEWMVKHLDAHPLFVRLTDAELEGDVCLAAAMSKTEEGIKVARNEGDKYAAVYRRIDA